MPWRIASIGPALSFRTFFETAVKFQIPNASERDTESLLKQVFLGKSKDFMDLVDCDLNMDEVVPVFGPFVKYIIVER